MAGLNGKRKRTPLFPNEKNQKSKIEVQHIHAREKESEHAIRNHERSTRPEPV